MSRRLTPGGMSSLPGRHPALAQGPSSASSLKPTCSPARFRYGTALQSAVCVYVVSGLVAAALLTAPALAQSTKGGDGGQGNVASSPPGGTSSLTGTGGNGSGTSESYEGAGGGGAGVTGGNGGNASNGGLGGLGGATPGASGGDGVGGGVGSRASGGGGGAHGAVYVSAGNSVATAVGGTGGAGGDSSDGDGGGGGAGGYGIVVDTSGPFVLNHVAAGGNGGRGGTGYFYGGSGGDGGHGLAFAGGATATINAAVTGGNGGAAGTFVTSCCAVGSNGAGGIGIVGSNISLSLNAVVTGGLSGDGVSRAPALKLGGSNHITLGTGWGLVGGVVVDSGGSIDFDQASDVTLGSSISGAGSMSKSGAGTLTLSGNNSYAGGTAINGGVLEVSSDTNLGAPSGGLTFNGGTLATTASFDTGRTVTLSTTGAINVAVSTELGLTGTVTGLGDLVKRGAGTLRLDNAANTYGNTVVEAGTLIGNAVTISGNLSNAATVVFNQTIDGSFGGDIGSLGAVNGTMVKSGAGNLTLTGDSLLDWSIDFGALTTAADRFGGNASIDSNGTLIFDQGIDAEYGGVFTGSGDFEKSGAGTLVYNGNSSAYGGTTTVAAGRLIVGSDMAHASAVLGGSVNVGNGATLGGHGTLGSGIGSVVMIGSGGTVAPGNSIGTITVDGDFLQAAGSTYLAEIAPDGSSDLIQVTGTATINGGTVFVAKAPGVYAPGTRFTLLTAAGGVTGQYATLDQNMPFVDLALAYDSLNIFLDVSRNNNTFSTAGITRNQRATAVALESLGSGNALYDAIASAPDAETARAEFEALSGEVHASAKSALINDSRFVRDAVNDRMRSASGETTGSHMLMSGYGPDGTMPVTADSSGTVLWGQAFGAWGSDDGDGNAARLDSTTGGFLAGLDGELEHNVRLGLLAGYGRTTFDVDDRASSASSENWHLGLYGGDRWNAVRLSGGLAYTFHDIATSRSVVIPGFADSLSGNYDAGTFQAFGEAGYHIEMASGSSFEPYANLAYVNLHTHGFAENGGVAALSAGGDNTDAVLTTLGVNFGSAFELAGLNAKAHGRLGWRHAIGDTAPVSTQSLTGSDAFTVTGVPIARDTALIEAGLDVDVSKAATLGIAYQGEFGNGALQSGLKADFSIRF